MPSLELAAGQVLTAAHTNTYWMRQAIATGLSSARPTGYEGRAVYDTDTDALNIYASPTTGWKPPWNLPWGVIAVGTISARAAAGGLASVASLSFNAVAGRRLRVQAGFTAIPAGSSTFEVPIVLDGATTIGGGFAGLTDVATPVNAEALFSTSTGSHTVEVFTNVAGGANVAVGVNATATVPVFIIEDVGPSGAPA